MDSTQHKQSGCTCEINLFEDIETIYYNKTTVLFVKNQNKRRGCHVARNTKDRSSRAMKRVVLFKGESEEYRRAFCENQFEAVFVEPLQFDYVQLEALARRLDEPYSGLVLTSPRAVEAAARVWDLHKFEAWKTRAVYVVGEASARQVALRLGLEPRGADAGNAANLADIIISAHPEHSKFLFPCGNLRSETLPDMLQSKNITVDSLTVYETMENENLKADLMELNSSGSDPCCMVFFSPSGCEYIHRQLQTFSNRLTNLPYFAIGNSTAHKIQNLGVEIAGVAKKPCPESVIQSVQNYFAQGTCS